jgi:DNA-binding transcriptional LysR family regulator
MFLALSCLFGIMTVAMELRHLRYFLAVGEALSFTKASSQLRVAQPALSRQVQDLEEEIGVDLFKRSPRGVTLTAEGKLFLNLARDLLKHADESVEQVRSLARGHYGELHVGYAASPTVEILPPALAAFQKAFPRVNVLLHDGSRRELIEGLQSGALQLALMPKAVVEGIEFETLRAYPFCVAFAPGHPFARLKSVPLEKMATEPLVGFTRKDYPDYYSLIDGLFHPLGLKPRIAVECDSASSLIMAIESGRGVALALSVFKIVSGQRLAYRPLAGIKELIPVGIARTKNGDVTPAGEKFCEILRKVSKGTAGAKSA